jgi:transposase
MNMVKLSKVMTDEHKAEEFLREIGILKTFRKCPYCGNKQFGKVRRNFYKCYLCKREWSVRKGSILERMKIPFNKFVLALKLFELEIPVLKACKELELSYNTVHKLFMVIRVKIYKKSSEDNLLKGEVEADESYFGGKKKGKRGRGAKSKIPVFGILERKGKVKVEIVKDVKSETLLKETIRKVKRGSLIYTDKFRSYDGLVMYGFRHERIDHSKRFANGKVYINGIEGFWSYAKGKLLKFHGLSPKTFKYYLKELEFRYNNRNENLFDKIVEAIRGGMN